MIEFNIPLQIGKEKEYLNEVFNKGKFSGDGPFTRKCHQWLEEYSGSKKALLTTSCSHALEMTALLAEINAGDEVIMPSFTFVSTANAFALRGAKIVFVDIRPDTMNIDEKKIEAAITSKTKAIVPVHYAGVSCEMDIIVSIAKKHDLFVIEDAAQCIGSYYKGKPVGTMGDMSCFSFHETKNIHSGEGGALLINREEFSERAEIIREKGTNRSRFLRGQVDKYTWVDIGSSYLPSELNAAVLYAQLEEEKKITSKRLEIWNQYYNFLSILKDKNKIELPYIPEGCEHNAHLFSIKLNDITQRQDMIKFLSLNGVNTVFHYIPLHSAYAGQKFGTFHGDDHYTTKESERLLRLPLHLKLSVDDVNKICSHIIEFFNNYLKLMLRLIRKIKAKIFPKKYKSQIEYWNDRAKSYGVRSVIHLGHSEEELEKITQFQKEFLLPKLKNVLNGSEETLLDFGCGPGRFSGSLAEVTKCKVVAIDPIEHLINLAPKVANVEYRVMPEGKIPLDDGTMDIVWICLVFGSITDQVVLKQTISEIKRVLKKDGTIFMIEKTSEDLSHFQTKSVEFYKELFDFVDLKKIDEYKDIKDCNTVFTGKFNAA